MYVRLPFRVYVSVGELYGTYNVKAMDDDSFDSAESDGIFSLEMSLSEVVF